MNVTDPNLPTEVPTSPAPEAFFDAGEAVERLIELYQIAVSFLSIGFRRP